MPAIAQEVNVSLRNLRKSWPRTFEDRKVPVSSSNVTMSGMIATPITGSRLLSFRTLSCGINVTAEKLNNPIVELRAWKTIAIRHVTLIILAVASREKRKIRMTIAENIIFASSTDLLSL